MDTELEALSVIDWEEGKRLAGNNQDLADDILHTLMIGLPNDMMTIKQLYNSKAYEPLADLLHKLHGALCYCGTPRLKTVVAQLESDLRNNIMDSLPLHFDRLEAEATLLLDHYSRSSK